MSSPLPPLAELAPGLSAAGKLDPNDIEALAAAGVRTIINNRPDAEDPGQLPAGEARNLAEAHGIAYHHIPFTAATLTRADVDAFAAALYAASQQSSCCRSGARSTLIWALTRLREGADPNTLIAEAARHGIDIAALPAIAARLRSRAIPAERLDPGLGAARSGAWMSCVPRRCDGFRFITWRITWIRYGFLFRHACRGRAVRHRAPCRNCCASASRSPRAGSAPRPSAGRAGHRR